MRKRQPYRAGRYLLVLGILMLLAGIVLMLTVDTALVAVMLSGSIVVNTAAICLLQRAGRREPGKQSAR